MPVGLGVAEGEALALAEGDAVGEGVGFPISDFAASETFFPPW